NAATWNAKAHRLMTVRSQHPDNQAELLAHDIAMLEAEYDEVRAAIRRASPAYAALTQPQPLDAASIQRDVLDQNTTLIEYSLGDEASYAWLVDRQNIRSFRLPPRKEIE